MQSWIQDNEGQSKVCCIPLTQPWKRHLTSHLKDLISYLQRKRIAVGVLFSLSFCLDWEYFGIALCTVAMWGCKYNKTSPQVCFRSSAGEQKLRWGCLHWNTLQRYPGLVHLTVRSNCDTQRSLISKAWHKDSAGSKWWPHSLVAAGRTSNTEKLLLSEMDEQGNGVQK